MGGLFRKMLGFAAGDRQFWRMVTDTFSYSAGQFPSHDAARLGRRAAAQYASGSNPYDPFRQRSCSHRTSSGRARRARRGSR